MNKNNARDYLPLVQALAEGRTIQCSDDMGGWNDDESPAFLAGPSSYRIKPEPREVWVTFNSNGTPLCVADNAPGYVAADSRGERAYSRRYREVIE